VRASLCGTAQKLRAAETRTAWRVARQTADIGATDYVRHRTVVTTNARTVGILALSCAPIFFGRRSMSADSDTFARYATAERELCESVGATLAQAIQEIEDKFGIQVAELRVTMDRAGPLGASRANCVLVREVPSIPENNVGSQVMGTGHTN
jgi:hypothetical protein